MGKTAEEILFEIKNNVSKDLYGIPLFEDLVHKFSMDRKLVPLNVFDEVIIRYLRVINHYNLSNINKIKREQFKEK